MIYTITLNTALDRTIFVKSTHPDDCNRIEQEQVYAGGKGVDVSKVLTALGVGNKALGFVGGFAGEELEGLLVNEGPSAYSSLARLPDGKVGLFYEKDQDIVFARISIRQIR